MKVTYKFRSVKGATVSHNTCSFVGLSVGDNEEMGVHKHEECDRNKEVNGHLKYLEK